MSILESTEPKWKREARIAASEIMLHAEKVFGTTKEVYFPGAYRSFLELYLGGLRCLGRAITLDPEAIKSNDVLAILALVYLLAFAGGMKRPRT